MMKKYENIGMITMILFLIVLIAAIVFCAYKFAEGYVNKNIYDMALYGFLLLGVSSGRTNKHD